MVPEGQRGSRHLIELFPVSQGQVPYGGLHLRIDVVSIPCDAR
jgi:hypothetical protein